VATAPGAFRTAGHEPHINPGLRFTGIVGTLGNPDAAGRVYPFRVAPIGPRAVAPTTDESRGWRLTVLAEMGRRSPSARLHRATMEHAGMGQFMDVA
jgi:hypothetical protein